MELVAGFWIPPPPLPRKSDPSQIEICYSLSCLSSKRRTDVPASSCHWSDVISSLFQSDCHSSMTHTSMALQMRIDSWIKQHLNNCVSTHQQITNLLESLGRGTGFWFLSSLCKICHQTNWIMLLFVFSVFKAQKRPYNVTSPRLCYVTHFGCNSFHLDAYHNCVVHLGCNSFHLDAYHNCVLYT